MKILEADDLRNLLPESKNGQHQLAVLLAL